MLTSATCHKYCSDTTLPHKSALHLLRALNSVLAWQTACRHVFNKGRRLQRDRVKWRLFQFRYREHALSPCTLDVETVMGLLRAWPQQTGKPCGFDDAQDIIDRAANTKVHAEAALMHWIDTAVVSFFSSRLTSILTPRIAGCWLQPGLAHWGQ